MADVGWVKLSTQLFENRKIKYLLSQPKGQEMVLVWVRLLCVAGTVNDGGRVYVSKRIPYTPELLAADTGVALATVKKAEQLFCDLDMLSVDKEGFIDILGWSKHQNIAGLNKIKDQSKDRVRRYREKQKNGDVTECNGDVTECNGDVTDDVTECNGACNGDVTVHVTECNGACNGDVTVQNKKRKEKRRIEDDYHHLHNDDDEKCNGKKSVTCNGDIFLLWEKNIMPLAPLVGEKLKALIDEVGEAAVEYAITAAVEHGARNFSYVQTVARNYASGNSEKPRKEQMPF